MVRFWFGHRLFGGLYIPNDIYGLIMKIKIEKKLNGDDIIKTEELHIELPQTIIDELDWEDGTVVEWEVQGKGLVTLRNIEGIDIE